MGGTWELCILAAEYMRDNEISGKVIAITDTGFKYVSGDNVTFVAFEDIKKEKKDEKGCFC